MQWSLDSGYASRRLPPTSPLVDLSGAQLKISMDTRHERYGVKKKETREVNKSYRQPDRADDKDFSSETWTCLLRERHSTREAFYRQIGIPPRGISH
ncbi:hypothetical protein ACLB2K_020375 [Fragaria x ananassa]